MNRHNTDEAAWKDEGLSWEERVEALRLAMQEWELTSGVDRRHIRVVTTDEAERELMSTTVSKEDRHEAQIGLINERLAGLEGHLFGTHGTDGAFGELKSDMKAILKTIEQMHQDFHLMSERHSADIQDLKSAQQMCSKDINAVGEIARANRDSIMGLQKSSGQWLKKARDAMITALVGAALIAAWTGIQALL